MPWIYELNPRWPGSEPYLRQNIPVSRKAGLSPDMLQVPSMEGWLRVWYVSRLVISKDNGLVLLTLTSSTVGAPGPFTFLSKVSLAMLG